MSKKITGHTLRAFTLTELLVVLAIVGILVLIALPNLMPLISKARSTEAQQTLGHIYSLQKMFYYENSKYSNELLQIGFEANKEANNQYTYQVVSASNTSFVARATAKTDFDNDGNINVWEIDQDKNLKQVTPD